MASMSPLTRTRIIDAAESTGFLVQLKPEGRDLYDKNMVFKSRIYDSTVYIHKETGVNKTSGNFSYLKVAVRPDAFREDLVNPALGIQDYINNISKQNRHHSSNYRDFPADIAGKKEPHGKCYKVMTLDALTRLLAGLGRAS